ncbi:MAG: sulfatase [Reichenbachiella sp.]
MRIIQNLFLIKLKIWVVVAMTSPFIFSCENSQKTISKKPNIVWITSEDNSKHYMKLFDENGIETPNIEKLADQGVKFTRAFSNAAVCSAARSTLISGCYGPRVASHYHRKMEKVPLPVGLKMFPSYLREAGYYTTNNSKEDYNFIKDEGAWDESSKKAHWNNRKEGQPFFHVFNIGTTHEGKLHFSKEQMDTIKTSVNPDAVFVQPNHPNSETFRYTNAKYRDLIQKMDEEVGAVVSELVKEDLMDDTFIFYYGDHGGVLPGSKGYLYETGLHVPLVIYIPENFHNMTDYQRGSSSSAFVSFVDFGATVLKLVGIDIPSLMDGKPFLGTGADHEEMRKSDETFSYADRFDEKYDMVRALRKGKFKYIRSYQPFNYDGLNNNYRYKQLAYGEWEELYKKGELDAIQSTFYEERAPELLFNIEQDPFETNDLSSNPKFKEILLELRSELNQQVKSMPDLSFYPEHFLVSNAFENPVAFGQTHVADINQYLEISNLTLLPFAEADKKIEEALDSSDPWSRYWGLIVCTTFGQEATKFSQRIQKILKVDEELINRVRASEFLAIISAKNPTESMISSLYESTDAVESLLILNSMALLGSHKYGYSFDIDLDKLNEVVLDNNQVQRRLEYLSN